jgi:protein SCO1/2
MLRRWLTVSFLACVLAISGCARAQPALGTLWDAPSFDLIDQGGAPFSSTSLAGKVWVVDFFYSNCQDECPIYLSPKMRMLQEQITNKGLESQVKLISITVDPKRDTPQVLQDYATRYAADPGIWSFLTGPDSTIQGLLQNGFKVGSAIWEMPVTVTVAQAGGGASSNYTILHSPYMLLVDQQGKIRQEYDGTQVDVSQIFGNVSQLVQAGMEQVKMNLTLRPDPPAVGDATLTVSLSDAAGRPISGAQVQVRGDMAHGAMEPVLGAASGSDSGGQYQVPFRWTMGGDWVLHVQAALADGHQAWQDFPVTVPGGGV